MDTKNIPFVIGLAGRKGSGKTTLATLLGASAIAVSGGKIRTGMPNFAAPLKDMVAMLLSYKGIPQSELPRFTDGDMKEEPLFGNATARSLMQTLGTEWGRNTVDENLWVGIAENLIKNHIDEFKRDEAYLTEKGLEDKMPARPFFIFGDVRFPNELELIRQYGGKVFWVSRAAEPADGHASEQSIRLSDCDGKIDNNGHIADALKQLLDGCGFYPQDVADTLDGETTPGAQIDG